MCVKRNEVDRGRFEAEAEANFEELLLLFRVGLAFPPKKLMALFTEKRTKSFSPFCSPARWRKGSNAIKIVFLAPHLKEGRKEASLCIPISRL